ncbi:uncharacterized protein LOC116853762 [Odontomachus brunneus]|uniref:uncharacterized protein LOC116853761 n=1 Tax=Odontomachus brunneus TaxID=486640 RepID=UPI0013F29F7F|nr:uncharacterized protein LOC116853761 [Odontomachus brunneus]XP_032690846.1 uncharacterized protein LOC116853762 [Odontomachus brunneus]
MEVHTKIRSQKTQWKSDHVNIVDYLRKRLKLDRFSEECIQMACGILEINTFEIRTMRGYSARALYPTVAMMNHSCVSNTSHTISPIDYRYNILSSQSSLNIVCYKSLTM